MINERELASVLLRERIGNAVDVFGAFDNCFFNSYAVYVLANNLPFPEDLFTPNPENKNSPAERLKEIFKSKDDLEIFSTRHQQGFPGSQASEMLAEKSLVLGVLYREWFVDQLLKNKNHRDELFSNDVTTKVSFLKLINAYRSNDENTVLSDDRMAPIYLANRDFFQKLSKTPQGGEEQDFLDYWNNEGYKKYCKRIASPYVKVSFTDFDPVLKANNVHYTLYSKQDASITASNEGDASSPHFELAISERGAHYTLLKDNRTEVPLRLYQASMVQYKEDREAILNMNGTKEDKTADCRSKPSQLVAATCPRDTFAIADPIQVLIATTTEIKTSVSQRTLQTESRIPEETELTEKELEVFRETIKSVSGSKCQAYRDEVKSLILKSRNGMFSTKLDNEISTKDIESAEALEGESDEKFAQRLQDAEFRRVGLK